LVNGGTGNDGNGSSGIHGSSNARQQLESSLTALGEVASRMGISQMAQASVRLHTALASYHRRCFPGRTGEVRASEYDRGGTGRGNCPCEVHDRNPSAFASVTDPASSTCETEGALATETGQKPRHYRGALGALFPECIRAEGPERFPATEDEVLYRRACVFQRCHPTTSSPRRRGAYPLGTAEFFQKCVGWPVSPLPPKSISEKNGQ
jgi:hypothetical protein